MIGGFDVSRSRRCLRVKGHRSLTLKDSINRSIITPYLKTSSLAKHVI